MRNDGDFKMAEVFLSNLPHNCSDRELRDWVESRGIITVNTRIILDLETGVGPAFAYVEIQDESMVKSAAAILNGRKLRNYIVTAKPVQVVFRDPARSAAAGK